ncbi:hypothetical protein [Streptomyces sp. NPDC055140]
MGEDEAVAPVTASDSIGRPHLAGLTPSQRRRLARDFRAEAFEVAVDILLDLPETVPAAQGGIPPWEQVYPLAAGIAHYYWFDPAAMADPDETARILATADRRPVPFAAIPDQRSSAIACVEELPT